ncbi:MAG: hypothetical protein ACP5PJ_04200 [Acidimicrobiales bacterium]
MRIVADGDDDHCLVAAPAKELSTEIVAGFVSYAKIAVDNVACIHPSSTERFVRGRHAS